MDAVRTPLISALCPSRGRPHLLRESVASLLRGAVDPRGVEVLVRFDDDDPGRAAGESGLPDGCVRFAGPRLGYVRMHDYYNDLARAARGDWLLLWNDDAVMLTHGWDQILTRDLEAARPVVVNPTGHLNTFPLVSRGYLSRLGRLSGQAHVDSWIQEVSRAAGCEVDRSDLVHIDHRKGIEQDATWREVAEAVLTTSPDFYAPAHVAERARDVAALLRDAP